MKTVRHLFALLMALILMVSGMVMVASATETGADPAGEADAITGEELLAALEGISGSYDLGQNVVISSAIEIPSDVNLQLTNSNASITVADGGSLTIPTFLGVTTGGTVTVEEGGNLILNGTLSVGEGGIVAVHGTLEHYAKLECAGTVIVYGGYIAGDDAYVSLLGNGAVLLTPLDRFLHDVAAAEASGEALTVFDEITLTEDLTINMTGELSFVDYSKLVVPNGVTLTLNGPVMFNDAELIVEEGGKVISNADVTLNAHNNQNGKAIINGTYVNNAAFWINTGSYADINGTMESTGPIHVGYAEGGTLNINGTLSTTGYLNVGDWLNLNEGGTLNILNNENGCGYLEVWGTAQLRGTVNLDGLMASCNGNESGEFVAGTARIEVYGTLNGSDTSTTIVYPNASISVTGNMVTAGEVTVEETGALWVDGNVTFAGPAPVNNCGAIHINYFDEDDAKGVMNLNTTANVNGYLAVHEGGTLNTGKDSVLNINNDENGCGYLDNHGHVSMDGTMNLDGLFTTGAAKDDNGNVIGSEADALIRGTINGSETSSIGALAKGSINCHGTVTTAGEVVLEPEGALWMENTFTMNGPAPLTNNGWLHVNFFDEDDAKGVLNLNTTADVNGYLAVHEGGTLNTGKDSILNIKNDENGCGYLDNQGTVTMDGTMNLDGIFTTGAACDSDGNVVGSPASAVLNGVITTSNTSSFAVLKDGTVNSNASITSNGEMKVEADGCLVIGDKVTVATGTLVVEDGGTISGDDACITVIGGYVSGVPENMIAEASAEETLDQVVGNDSMTTEEKVEAVQKLDAEELKTAMEENTDVVDQIAALEAEADTTVTVEVEESAEDTNIDQKKVTIIGAGLNTPVDDAADISLVISQPSEEKDLDAEYDSKTAVQFSMTLENVQNTANLEVPVQITLPVPAGMNEDLLVLLHYHGDGVEEVKINVSTDGDQTYISFILSGFSDFVLAEKKVEEESPFVDVSSGAYYYDPVLWAVGEGITAGKDDTHFAPNEDCTRAQIVTFLWRSVGCPAPKTSDNPFVDVKDSAYYYNAVLWAVENGITSGKDATHFAPSEPCTRAQVATFLWRAMKNPAPKSSDNPFVDVAAGKYYYDAVLWAVENNITAGKTATEFQPNATCTRAQIVTFLYRMMVEQGIELEVG